MGTCSYIDEWVFTSSVSPSQLYWENENVEAGEKCFGGWNHWAWWWFLKYEEPHSVTGVWQGVRDRRGRTLTGKLGFCHLGTHRKLVQGKGSPPFCTAWLPLRWEAVAVTPRVPSHQVLRGRVGLVWEPGSHLLLVVFLWGDGLWAPWQSCSQ